MLSLGLFVVVKRIFINPISYTLGASLHAAKKQVLSTWVYVRCPQVVECEV